MVSRTEGSFTTDSGSNPGSSTTHLKTLDTEPNTPEPNSFVKWETVIPASPNAQGAHEKG